MLHVLRVHGFYFNWIVRAFKNTKCFNGSNFKIRSNHTFPVNFLNKNYKTQTNTSEIINTLRSPEKSGPQKKRDPSPEDFERFFQDLFNSQKNDSNNNKKQNPNPFNSFYYFIAGFIFIMFFLPLITSLFDFTSIAFSRNTWKSFRDEVLVTNDLRYISINSPTTYTAVSKSGKRYRLSAITKDHFITLLEDACDGTSTSFTDIAYIDHSSSSVTDWPLWIIGAIVLSLPFILSKIGSITSKKPNMPRGMMDLFNMGSNFKSYKPTSEAVTFKDVKGCDEAKMEIAEFVEFLKDPSKFQSMGAKIPKGAILYGPPGTGKTLLAKAVAGEASVPFFFASGSQFIEMLVGLGARRMRDLFEEAKQNAPSIIFIDEIDAIGGSRNSFRSHQEHEQTLNQLLCELDGFDTKTNVVLLCGTNQFQKLDSALIRPGRLDRKVYLAPPDLKGRIELFEYYLAKIKINPVGLMSFAKRLAGLTPGSTGADIASICNEGAIVACRKSAKEVEMNHLEQALDRLILGNRLTRKLSETEKRCVSIHESGHAIVSWFLAKAPPLLKVSIIPRGMALGVNQFLNTEETLLSKEHLLDMMASILGGRAAEEIMIGTISTGAADDLEKVTTLAYGKVASYGMDESVGLLSFPSIRRKFSQTPMSGNDSEYGPELANKIDAQVQQLISTSYALAKSIIEEKKDLIIKLSEKLYEKETLTNAEIESILGPRPTGAITVSNIMSRVDECST